MRMYELWKVTARSGEPSRLEEAGGPVLFWRQCDAEEYSRTEEDSREAAYTIVSVRVGRA